MGQRINNEKGEVLGYFLSEEEYTKAMYALAHREFDRQEAEDRANGIVREKWDGKGGLTTEEIMALAIEKAGLTQREAA
jgi:hypothetical protein